MRLKETTRKALETLDDETKGALLLRLLAVEKASADLLETIQDMGENLASVFLSDLHANQQDALNRIRYCIQIKEQAIRSELKKTLDHAAELQKKLG